MKTTKPEIGARIRITREGGFKPYYNDGDICTVSRYDGVGDLWAITPLGRSVCLDTECFEIFEPADTDRLTNAEYYEQFGTLTKERIAELELNLASPELHRECKWQLDAEILRRVEAEQKLAAANEKLAVQQAGREELEMELLEQEPVGFIRAYGIECLQGTLINITTGKTPPSSSTTIFPRPLVDDDIPLYTKPFPQQKPLIEDVIYELSNKCLSRTGIDKKKFARKIEAAHGITEKE